MEKNPQMNVTGALCKLASMDLSLNPQLRHIGGPLWTLPALRLVDLKGCLLIGRHLSGCSWRLVSGLARPDAQVRSPGGGKSPEEGEVEGEMARSPRKGEEGPGDRSDSGGPAMPTATAPTGTHIPAAQPVAAATATAAASTPAAAPVRAPGSAPAAAAASTQIRPGVWLSLDGQALAQPLAQAEEAIRQVRPCHHHCCCLFE